MDHTTRARFVLEHVGPIALVLAGAGCSKHDKPGGAQTTGASMPADSAARAADDKAPPPPTEAPPPSPAVTFADVGLSGPESVIVDESADHYIVSNVDGDPAAADNSGFISRLLPDGTRLFLRWIQGGQNKVKLNAPKGMAFRDGYLYVADIDTVRIFDRKNGAPAGEVRIAGARFLNGVALAPDGRILVSDSGLHTNPKGDGLEPSGTDAVYAIDKDRKITVASKKRLGGPTGLLPVPTKIWAVAFGSGEIYAIDSLGNVDDVQKLPKGSLDGIVSLGEEMLVSSWMGSAIYRGKPGGTWKVAIADLKSPGRIGYDRKRGRVLVPLFADNEVRAYEMK